MGTLSIAEEGFESYASGIASSPIAAFFDMENLLFEIIDKDHSFLSELQSSFSNYSNSLNTRSFSGHTYNVMLLPCI